MDWIKDIMRKRLSFQHRGKNMIGSIALNELKAYLNIERIDSEVQDEILTWYVRHNKLFIKTAEQSLKIQIFRDKLDILLSINKKLSEIWYKIELDDIIFK